MAATLVDTSLLAWAWAAGDADPRSPRARGVILDLVRRGEGYVSVQTLAEFARMCEAHAVPKPPPEAVRDAIASMTEHLAVVRPSVSTVRTALDGVRRHKLAFWDAMLWATARENGIDEVLGDRVEDGRVFEGVKFTRA